MSSFLHVILLQLHKHIYYSLSCDGVSYTYVSGFTYRNITFAFSFLGSVLFGAFFLGRTVNETDKLWSKQRLNVKIPTRNDED